MNALLVSLMMREGPVVFVEVGLGWDGGILARFRFEVQRNEGEEGGTR